MGIRRFFWNVRDFLEFSDKKFPNIIASRNGKLYQVLDSPIGRLVLPAPILPELDEVREGFQYALPKVPAVVLEQTLSFFKDYCKSGKETEVMVQIFWNEEEKQYLLFCPKQRVGKGFVHAEYNAELLRSGKYHPVMEIHSHNTMEAYFSKTDDENEVDYMLYGVVGNLHLEQPDMCFRVGFNGQFMNLPINAIFEAVNLSTYCQYPEEWHKQVTVC